MYVSIEYLYGTKAFFFVVQKYIFTLFFNQLLKIFRKCANENEVLNIEDSIRDKKQNQCFLTCFTTCADLGT